MFNYTIKYRPDHVTDVNGSSIVCASSGENEVYKVALKDCSCELAVGPEYLDILREKLHKGQF